MIYYRLHAIYTSHNPYAALWPSLHTTCYMLHTTCFTTGDVLNFLPICAMGLLYYFAIHATCSTTSDILNFYFIVTWLSQADWPTLPHFSSHLYWYLPFLHPYSHSLENFYFVFHAGHIFCLGSTHANRCQYQHGDLLQCFLITLLFMIVDIFMPIQYSRCIAFRELHSYFQGAE